MTEKPNPDISRLYVADPGVDDAVAILLAMAESPGTKKAFVATYGNASTLKTSKNFSFLSQFEHGYGRNREASAQVFIGADRAAAANEAFEDSFELIHGVDGMNGLGSSASAIEQGSDELYAEIARADTQNISVVSLGALTELVMITNTISNNIGSVTIMGGAFAQQGNVGPHREANMRHDPAAFQHVLEFCNQRGIPLNLVPLDMTEKDFLEMTPEHLVWMSKRMREKQAPAITHLLNSLLAPGTAYTDFYMTRGEAINLMLPIPEPHNYEGAPVHDLTAVWAATYQEMFSWRKNARIQADDTGDVGYARDYFPGFPFNGLLGTVNVPVTISSPEMESYYFYATAKLLALHFS